MQEVKRFWFSLSSGQQMIVIGLLVVLIWWATTKGKAYKIAVENNITKKTELQVLAKNGVKASYSDAKLQDFANGLFQAIDSFFVDEERAARIFSYLHNNVDYIKMDNAFGIRASKTANPLSFEWFKEPRDMKTWLKEKLSKELISSINAKLKSQGLTKQIK